MFVPSYHAFSDIPFTLQKKTFTVHPLSNLPAPYFLPAPLPLLPSSFLPPSFLPPPSHQVPVCHGECKEPTGSAWPNTGGEGTSYGVQFCCVTSRNITASHVGEILTRKSIHPLLASLTLPWVASVSQVECWKHIRTRTDGIFHGWDLKVS